MNKNEAHENGLVIVLLWVCLSVCVCVLFFFYSQIFHSTLIHCIWLMNKCIDEQKKCYKISFSSSVNDFECVMWIDRDYSVHFAHCWCVRPHLWSWICLFERINRREQQKYLNNFKAPTTKHSSVEHQSNRSQKGINHFDQDFPYTIQCSRQLIMRRMGFISATCNAFAWDCVIPQYMYNVGISNIV